MVWFDLYSGLVDQILFDLRYCTDHDPHLPRSYKVDHDPLLSDHNPYLSQACELITTHFCVIMTLICRVHEQVVPTLFCLTTTLFYLTTEEGRGQTVLCPRLYIIVSDWFAV